MTDCEAIEEMVAQLRVCERQRDEARAALAALYTATLAHACPDDDDDNVVPAALYDALARAAEVVGK